MVKIEEVSGVSLARLCFPELFWFVFNKLSRIYGDHNLIRIERLLKEDAAQLTWFLLREQFVVINRYYTAERPTPWKFSWREQTHAEFWTEQFASFRMIENDYTPAVELIPFIDQHIQGD